MKIIEPSRLSGEITVQPSKSAMHRALICAALSDGASTLDNIILSEDIKATLNALNDMGFCEFTTEKDRIIIYGNKIKPSKRDIECGESGSTLRMLLPVGLDGVERRFYCRGRLIERPMTPYQNLFDEYGILFKKEMDYWILKGELSPGNFLIDGNISSQFISGLMFKLPLLEGDSKISIKPPIESRPYIKLTQFYQSLFGIESEWKGNNIEIKGNQTYLPADLYVEGDYSHAAFFAVGAALNGSVKLKGLIKNSEQGDKQIFDILNIMGAEIIRREDFITIKNSNNLKSIEIDASQIPDLVPILAVAACGAKGMTKIYNAARLRIKESDRLSAISNELEKLGADIAEYEDSLIIHGRGYLNGGEVYSHNDHRIAMALTVASCISDKDIKIKDWEAVNKSAPDFFEQFKKLGGRVIE